LYTVKGHVQGVWFRDSTRKEARRLGITGYVRNLTGGDVEVLATGNEAALDEFRVWLQRGPPMAKVCQIIEEPAPGQYIATFEIA
jgi:acylphosphatase